jgi:competence protein ComEA
MDRLPFSRRQLLVAALAAGILLLVAGRYLASAGAPSTQAVAARPVVPRLPVAASRLVVDVVGAVRRPGLYRLSQGTRIADAVARAGGAKRSADLAAINLAAPLADGEQVVVPERTPAGAGVPDAAGSGSSSSATQGPVHLNTATLEQLDTLPGVGPATAQKILDYRTEHGAFSSVDELDAVPGIGPKRLEELRKLVAL